MDDAVPAPPAPPTDVPVLAPTALAPPPPPVPAPDPFEPPLLPWLGLTLGVFPAPPELGVPWQCWEKLA
jgi:hypothetical protein